jgi:hypothetical protein
MAKTKTSSIQHSIEDNLAGKKSFEKNVTRGYWQNCLSARPTRNREVREEKSLAEKEAQNGEIASNYLIPDPKRINKPSDFISSFLPFSQWMRRRS